MPRHPRSTLFPYTTLFRSRLAHERNGAGGPRVHLQHVDEPVLDGVLDVDEADHAERFRERLGVAPHLLHLARSEEHTSELQSHSDLVCRLLLEKKKRKRVA